MALARCLLNFPQDTQHVFLPFGTQAQLDQLVRQRDRLVDTIRRRKQRIQDFTEAINPTLSNAMGSFALTEAGRAFLRTYLDPRKTVRTGQKRLTQFLQKRYRLNLDPKVAQAIFKACTEAVALYLPVREKDQIPFDETLLQEEMNWELDQLESEESRPRELNKRIRTCNQKLDPHDCMISLPGVQHILAAGIQSCVGDIDRFDSLTKHRGFAGFYPASKGTGDKQAQGTRICKMSSNRYKRYLYLAAENAYKWDVQLAAFYHTKREAGHTHTQAVCAVANGKLLPRIHHMMKQRKLVEDTTLRRPSYVFKDLSGNPISKAEAKAIIQTKWGDVSYA
jgi:transposase